MQKKDIRMLRDAALLLEKEDPQIAEGLMEMAQRERPDAPFIKRKMNEYKQRRDRDQMKLLDLIQTGELAIISAGFRCHTKIQLSEMLGIKQPSLPFDSGFFPPQSIANLLRNREVNLQFASAGLPTHHVCTKHTGVTRGDKKGIDFRTSSYDHINQAIHAVDQDDLNTYLDATKGYYTLDTVNRFVLAHYNWHDFASESLSKGITRPEENIPKINTTLNPRITRMFDMCARAKNILFVLGEFQNLNFMSIDDEVHDLTDMEPIKSAAKDTFGDKAKVVRFQDIDHPSKLLKHIAR